MGRLLKVPLLWVMKGSYLGFGGPPTTGWHACKVKKCVQCLIICIHFLPYLLNHSQTICATIHVSKPLLCVMLICCDWSNWSHFHFIMPVMPNKVAFVRAEQLCVQLYQGNRYFTAPKAAPSDKEFIYIFIQTNAQRPTSGRAIC